MFTSSAFENTAMSGLRTDAESFGFYAQTPSAPPKLQHELMIERLQLSSTSAKSKEFDIDIDACSKENPLDDDIKKALRLKPVKDNTDSRVHEHDHRFLIEDDDLSGWSFSVSPLFHNYNYSQFICLLPGEELVEYSIAGGHKSPIADQTITTTAVVES